MLIIWGLYLVFILLVEMLGTISYYNYTISFTYGSDYTAYAEFLENELIHRAAACLAGSVQCAFSAQP